MRTRSRFAAMAAVAGLLAGGIIAAGAMVANADSGLEIDSGPFVTDGAGVVTITGSADGSFTGSIAVYDGPDETASLVCTADYATVWSCSSPVPVGDHTFSAWQHDMESNSRSDVQTASVIPPEPSYTGPPTLTVTEGGTASFTGVTTTIRASVAISIPGVTPCDTGTFIPTNSDWTCDIDVTGLAPGAYSADIVQTVDGVESRHGSIPVQIDPAPSSGLALTSPADGDTFEWIADQFIDIAGVSDDTVDPVNVYLDYVDYTSTALAECTDIPVEGTDWSCGPIQVAPGTHTLTALQGDASSGVTITVTYPDPDLTTTTPITVEQGADVLIEGTATYPGVTVEVTTSSPVGDCTSDVVAAAGEPWSCTITASSTATGAFDLYVTQKLDGSQIGDFLQYTGGFVISPPGLAIYEPAEGSRVAWADPLDLTVSGTSELSTPIVLYLDGETPLDCTPATPGPWDCGPLDVGTLGLGAHFITAQQSGGPDAVADFDVVPPTPVPAQSEYSYPQGTGFLSISGTSAYPGSRVYVDLEVSDGETRSCDIQESGGTWSCDIPIDDLLGGTYNVFVHAEALDSGDETVSSDSTTVTLDVQSTPLALDCTFGPGSFDATDPSGTYYLDLYTLVTPPVDGDESPYTLGPPALCAANAGNQFPDATTFTDTYYDGDWNTLPPGIYELYAYQGEGGDYHDFAFTIPAAPLVSNGTSDATTITLTGVEAVPGDAIRVDGGSGDVLCSTTVGTGGDWECTFSRGTDSVAKVLQIDAESLGMSAYGGDIAIPTVSSGPAHPVSCTFAPAGVTASTSDPYVGVRFAPVFVGDGALIDQDGLCSNRAGITGLPGVTFGTWTNCYPNCTLSDLAPGLYAFEFLRSDGDPSGGVGSDVSGFERYDYVFRVPETPAIAQVASVGNSIAMTGTGTAGDTVQVVNPSAAGLCSTTVTDAGTWSCGFTATAAANARAIAIDPASGGLSAYSAGHAIPVYTVPTLPVTPTTPAVPDPAPVEVVKWLLEVGDLSNLKPGDHFSITVSGIPAGWTIQMVMHSDPYDLGKFTATGAPMTMDLVVPQDIEGGAHTVQMIATTPLGTNYYDDLDANVVVAGLPDTGDPTPEPTEEPGDGTPGHPTGGAGDRSDAGTPSALTGSLPTIAQILANPITIAFAGGIALALLLLVALPTELLNSSLESNSSRLGRGYTALDRALTRAQDWFIKVTHTRALAAAIIVVVISIVYGFVDPHFGFDIVSLRLVLSLAIAFFLLSYVASWISGLIIRRAWGAQVEINMNPTIILFAVIGVIVARILDFSPGFLIGIAIGIELLNATRKVAARAVLVQLGVIVAMAMVAWVIYSLFTPGADFFGMLTEDTLVATTAEGLTGAMIAVFPLRFLEGFELWENSKRLWVAAFVIIGVAFALIVLPTAIEGSEVRDYGVWIIVFAVFGAISLLIWWIFARADKRDEAKEEHEKVDAG